MDNPRPEKVAVVDEVRERLQSSDAALLTEYRGIDVAAMADLRRMLRDAGGDYKIYKNTLVRFAARDLGLEIDVLLTGPTAIAFVVTDPVPVARALRDFARSNPALVVKGGLLGTRVLSAEEARKLADVASREELLARIAGGLAAPLQQFAGLLQALPRNLAYGIKALIDKGGAAPEAEAAVPGAEAPAPEAPEAEAEPPAADEPETPAAETESDTPTSEEES